MVWLALIRVAFNGECVGEKLALELKAARPAKLSESRGPSLFFRRSELGLGVTRTRGGSWDFALGSSYLALAETAYQH